MKKIMLLGSGELGKEVVIAAKRLGQHVIAVDNYNHAPAMQVADECEVIDMQKASSLKAIVKKHKPDFIVPEIEAISTETLIELEAKGQSVVPSAKAAHLTMNRDAIRDMAAKKLKLRVAAYDYAESLEDLEKAVLKVGIPCVVKPVMSSSGKGQSNIYKKADIKKAWNYALSGRGNRVKVIVEQFIDFDSEITLMTLKQHNGKTLFCAPIGHRQELGDYRESWQPAKISDSQLKLAKKMAKKVTDELGGAGIFGVEFFLTKDNDVIFSELSPRPHDTGMVTMMGQNLSQFELHVRAILNLPIPKIVNSTPSASAVVLAKSDGQVKEVQGMKEALKDSSVELRVFGKKDAYKGRRLAVALACGRTIKQARNKATKAASLLIVKMR